MPRTISAIDYVVKALFLCAWAVHLALLWIYKTPPSLDYAQWLHQANVMAHYGDPGYSFDGWYTIAGVFIPNGGFSLPAALLAKVIPLEAAGKLVLSIYCIALPLSVRYMARSCGNQSGAWMLSILLLFNVSFVNGNIAFLVGCPLLFLAIGLLEKRAWSAGDLSVLTLLSVALSIAHAICAFALLLYLAIRWFSRGVQRDRRAWSLCWGGIILLLAVAYISTRSADASFFRFGWGMDARTRISLLAKSFVAGVTFPPYEFSAVRLIATSLLVLLAGAIFLASIRAGLRSRDLSSPMPAFFLLLVLCAIIAPKYVMGTGELSQRLMLIAFSCGLVLFQGDPGKDRRMAALLAIAVFVIMPVRSLEYIRSSTMLDARRDFIRETIPSSETVITFDDDLGADKVPFGYLVPKGITLIFQADYNLTTGGYDPLSFRTGYILPRNNFIRTIDSLTRLRKEPGFLAIRGIELPEDVGYVVLDFSSDFGDAMEARLAPIFAFAARKEIAPGIYTEVLKRQKSFATARTADRAGPAEDRYTH